MGGGLEEGKKGEGLVVVEIMGQRRVGRKLGLGWVEIMVRLKRRVELVLYLWLGWVMAKAGLGKRLCTTG